jgi:GNAT superfamily N-acetyltransferase
MKPNLERMIELADEFFSTKDDPTQLSVTPEVMERLRELHPATLTERDDGNGPIAWILLIPTIQDVMKMFIEKEISERDILDKTPLLRNYDALYLCSALVLPEYRGKGIARRLMCDAIASIRQDHQIKALFFWSFSLAGEALATSISREIDLPLFRRLS